MTKEELLQMLREKGMDDAAIKALLDECAASLGGQEEDQVDEAAEKAEASKLLGVSL